MQRRIEQLRAAKSLNDLAVILKYKPSTLAYIVYKIPDKDKYSEFDITKKSGGNRRIFAPNNKLKALQRRLADLLYDCYSELYPNEAEKNSSKSRGISAQWIRARKSMSFGFKKNLSSMSNAEKHIGKRYVFNCDLQEFFPSINFGRVYGYFIKNKNFRLTKPVATIIAQIACHDNILPQGSPCSPIISELIGQIMDLRLARLAKQFGCTYSRYVDDLTFSSNAKQFPSAIATKKWGLWQVGRKLNEEIVSSGFKINIKKTRQQFKQSRQTVTGLVVNKTVNINKDYYRRTRSMCASIFNRGFYYLEPIKTANYKKSFIDIILTIFKKLFKLSKFKIFLHVDRAPKNRSDLKNITSLATLEGRLSYIYQVKVRRNRFADQGYRPSYSRVKWSKKTDGEIKKNDLKYPPLDRCNNYSDESHQKSIDGIRNLYSKFLFFKNFYALEKPLIYCEGKTDIIYLKCAIKQLSASYPDLISDNNYKINFFNYTKSVSEIMQLAEGTSGMKYLIDTYSKKTSPFKSAGKKHPVILLIDNDSGAAQIFNAITKLRNCNPPVDGSDNFYFIEQNLYVVSIPKLNSPHTQIEDFFDQTTRQKTIDRKKFNPTNNSVDANTEYGKHVFATKVIKPNQNTTDFSQFKQILDRLVSAILDYKSRNLPIQHTAQLPPIG